MTQNDVDNLTEGTLLRYHGSEHLSIGKFYRDTQNIKNSPYRLRRITMRHSGYDNDWAMYRLQDYEIITEAQALLLMLEEQ